MNIAIVCVFIRREHLSTKLYSEEGQYKKKLKCPLKQSIIFISYDVCIPFILCFYYRCVIGFYGHQNILDTPPKELVNRDYNT